MTIARRPDACENKKNCNPARERTEKKWLALITNMPKKTPAHVLATKLVVSRKNPDCFVVIEDHKFPVHSIVFDCYTDFFKEFYNLQVICLPADKVTPVAFDLLYNWMLNNSIALPEKHILEVFRAAIFLEVKDLIKHCWRIFDETLQCNEAHAAVFQLKAKKRGLNILTPMLFNRISKFFLTYVATKEFCQLCIEEVCLLLSLSTVGVNTEVEILMTIIVWLMHDINTRFVHVNRLLECVRFYLLPVCYLCAFCFEGPSLLIPRILCTPEVRKMALNCFKRISNPFVNFYKQIFHKQRRWIYDKNCPYHHNEVCTYPMQLQYEDFKSYLTQLNDNPDINHWQSYVYKKEMTCEPPLAIEKKACQEDLTKKAPYVHVESVESDIEMICSERLIELSRSSESSVSN